MLKQLMDVWPIIVFLFGILIGIGKILHMITVIVERLDAHDARLDKSDTACTAFITVAKCDRCRDECERRNLAQFSEIKALLTDIGNKRDDYVGALSDVSCRLGRIEGKLDK